MWKVFKLPVVYRNQLVIDRSPLLGQLIKINDEYKNIVTLLIDRKKARIFRLEPDGCHEILDFFYPEASRTKKFKSTEGKFNQRLSPTTGTGSLVQGYGEHGFHRTIDNEIHQHYKYVADKVFYHFNENKFDFLVLGGTEKNISEFSPCYAATPVPCYCLSSWSQPVRLTTIYTRKSIPLISSIRN